MNCCDDICTQARNCPVRTYRLSTPAELAEMASPEPVLPAPEWLETAIHWAAVALVACTALAIGWIAFAEPISGLWQTFLQAAGKSGLG